MIEDFLAKKGYSVEKQGKKLSVNMGDYAFTIEGNTLVLPIPLPTGRESLDDLVAMGIKYARASRLVQGMGEPVEYKIEGSTLLVIKRFQTREELEKMLIKAVEGIESLRYFL
ncbi:MAG: hypothetical protein TQ35_0004410 [Candidatus Aramenus sulfurataquae]|jgi:hypothetical protein|uniref:Uncharacterized protein n=3 Tax=Candidatus Aramenus sulfurataquae TaxID=1326980 RepID=A0AAE3K1K4_9CREN|nr:hypothetical protein [Candidatus Aramenus sulfurataquae]